MTMTKMTCAVFWPRAPLLGTAAEGYSASSRTAHTPDSRVQNINKQPRASSLKPVQPSQRATSDSALTQSIMYYSAWYNFLSHTKFIRPPFSWPSPNLPLQLETNNNRSLDSPMCDGMPPGAIDHSSATGIPTSPGLKGSFGGAGGDRQVDLKRSDIQSKASERPVYITNLYSTKERWVTSSCSEPKAIESVYSEATIQDGRNGHAQEHHTKGRLDGISGPQGCLSLCGHDKSTQKVPEVHVGKQAVRVPFSPLQLEQCPSYIHKVAKTCDGTAETAGYPSHHVSGRYVDNGTIERAAYLSNKGSDQAVSVTGVCDKFREIDSGSKASDSVSRVYDRHSEDDDQPSTGEGAPDHSGLQVGFATDKLIGEGPVQTYRADDSHHAGSFTCTPLLQKPTEDQEQRVQSFSELHSKCDFGPQCEGGTALVENTIAIMERKGDDRPKPKHDNGDRCIPIGMGSSFFRSSHKRSVVREGTYSPHQSSGTNGRNLCSQNICSATEGHTSPFKDGQQNSSFLHKQDGRHEIHCTFPLSLSSMAVVPSEGNNSLSRISSREKQCDSRSRVPLTSIISRMDAQ